MASLVAAIASTAGADASAATTAAIIETENNAEIQRDADENPVTKFLKQFLPPPRTPTEILEDGGTKEEAAAAADAKFQQDAVIRGVELEKTILEAYSIVLPGAEAGLAAGAAERGAARGAVVAERVTGTVWDSITATQPLYKGTLIPRSFELSTPNGSIWVAPNATEHLAEYATANMARGVGADLQAINTQAQLTSLHSAVTTATAKGVPYQRIVVQDGWELIFSPPRQAGQLPVLKHALQVK